MFGNCPYSLTPDLKYHCIGNHFLFPIPLPCGRYQKIFETSRTSGSSPSGAPQNGSDLFLSEKKIVDGIQTDRLGLTVSTQKCVKFSGFGLECQFSSLFWYLGTRCIYFKTEFCVETVSLSRSI